MFLEWININVMNCKCSKCLCMVRSVFNGNKDKYLYSLSCRIPTGSKPWGFWIGVMRFCFCCIWSMGDTCCPGGWGATELPGKGPAGIAEAWGGAGDGRPLAAGVRCFWALAWFSPPWPGDQRLCLLFDQILLQDVSSDMIKIIKAS